MITGVPTVDTAPQKWACVELSRRRQLHERVEILERMKRFEGVGAASAMVAAFERAGR